MGCSASSFTYQTHAAVLDDSENILNMLDPNIKTEQQALAKAQASIQEGKFDNALFYYLKTLQFNPKNTEVLEQIALIHEQGKHPELAIKVYHDILKLDPKNAQANEKLGLFYLNKGQDGVAKAHFTQAVRADSERWKSHNGLGVIADLERNTDEAINHYQAALTLSPSNPLLLNNLGYSYYLKGDEATAKHYFNQALNFDTRYKRAIHNLALIEIKHNHFTAATVLFNRIMSVHETFNNIGYVAMLNGQYNAAEDYLNRAIEESPVYFPKAQENLKKLLTLKGAAPSYQPSSEQARQLEPTPAMAPEKSSTSVESPHATEKKHPNR